MAVRKILLLGNPTLRKICKKVKDPRIRETVELVSDLRDTLSDFKKRMDFGRGIAAPQIGIGARVIYVDSEYKGALINPKITKHNRKRFMLWDDCFSFPDILVKVERFQEISVAFMDEKGITRSIKAVGGFSELLQHEIDHLDGVLAIDRAIDSKHIILRSEYEKLINKTRLVL